MYSLNTHLSSEQVDECYHGSVAIWSALQENGVLMLLQIIQTWNSSKTLKRPPLPSPPFLNLDKSPHWPILSNLLWDRALCTEEEKPPKCWIYIGICVQANGADWQPMSSPPQVSYQSSGLCQRFEWVIGYLAWSFRTAVPPLLPSPGTLSISLAPPLLHSLVL